MAFDLSIRFKVCSENGSSTELSPSDHVASGGEGHVYRKGGTAFKLWDDPVRAVAGDMPERVRRLSAFRHPFVVFPDGLLRDRSGSFVGVSMPWVSKGWPTPPAFTDSWRAANGFDDAAAAAFASRMRSVVGDVHGMDLIMGDANESNVLGVGVGSASEPRWIDVDSWIPSGFSGDKLMETVRDPISPPFTKAADWFAWAIVTFQLLIGIHPFRGTHPDFARGDLAGRMAAGVSVFDRRVRLPAAVRPLSCVRSELLGWYEAVFGKGERSAPPDPVVRHRTRVVVAPLASAPRLSGVEMTLAWRRTIGASRVVAPDALLSASGELLSLPDGRSIAMTTAIGGAFSRLPDGTIFGVEEVDGRLRFGAVRAAPGAIMKMEDAGLAACGVWSAENRTFALTPEGILEIRPTETRSGWAAVPGKRWRLGPDASFFGDGAAWWNVLGAAHLVVPFGASSVSIVRVRELDGLRPVSIIGFGGVVVLSALSASGSYERISGRLSLDGARFELAERVLCSTGELACAISSGGVIVRKASDGALDAFAPATGARRRVPLSPDAFERLICGPSGTFCFRGDELFRLRFS
jgi:hypothetical protein